MLRKYFQDYQSDEDQDYNPTKQEEALYRQEQEKKKKSGMVSSSIQQLYQETKNQYYLSNKKKVKTDSEEGRGEGAQDLVGLAENILNSESLKPSKRVVFAGKEFMLNEETGQLELIEKKTNYEIFQHQAPEQNYEEFQQRKTHIAFQYLNHVMRAIYNRSRKINSVGKSKLDWNGFVKQEGIQDKLKYNRKGGVIENMHFIKKSNPIP